MSGCSEPDSGTADKKDLGAFCGLYCGKCPLYGSQCGGCKGKYEELAEHCQKCEIRPCAMGRAVKACAECSNFSCEKTEAFYTSNKDFGELAKNNSELIKARGYDKWLKDQQ